MNRKIIIIISFLAILTITLTYIIIKRPTSIVLYVDPKTARGTVGQDFTININISNVVDLYGWQLKLRWNTTILGAVNATEGTFLRSGGNTYFHQMSNATGYLTLDCTLLGNISGVGGNGALATIQFHVKESGYCDLDIYDTMLINSSEQLITHTVIDGHFSTIP